jgi:hypothetical protein
MNQSKTDLGIVNESQLLGFGISEHHAMSGFHPLSAPKRTSANASVYELTP